MLRSALIAVPFALAATSATAGDALRVRASVSMAPCARAAAAAQAVDATVTVAGVRGGGGDVLVGAAGEIDRALEAGRALADTDVEIARVPWVLVSSSGPADLDRLAKSGATVTVLDAPEAHEARRVLSGRIAPDRLRGARDAATLQSAAVRLVPLPLAGAGARTVVAEIAPLLAKAAVSAGSPRETAARAFVDFLGSEPGRAAFAACGERTAR